jgi:hypothetical protein
LRPAVFEECEIGCLQAGYVVALLGDADAQVDQVDVGMEYRLLLGEQVRAEQEERREKEERTHEWLTVTGVRKAGAEPAKLPV